MVTRPEDIYPALSEAYNAGDLEALVSLYDPKAVFVIKPGRITEGPAEPHSAPKDSRPRMDYSKLLGPVEWHVAVNL